MLRRCMVYRILVASPSDVVDERQTITEVVRAWNYANSYYRDIYLEPVLWETHASPEMGDRPQAIISKQLIKSCDFLIGVFWTRLGTPTGIAESGTVEEIIEFRDAQKPVLLYFSLVPIAPNRVNDNQYRNLLQFREQCEKEGLVSSYNSIDDFREQLQRHITLTVNSIHSSSD